MRMESRFKFRAWDGKQMLTMPIDTFFGIHRFFGAIDGPCILMQSTGLKDKNGKLIFEGDILKADEEGCIWEIAGNNGVVEWFPEKSKYLVNFKICEFKAGLFEEDMDCFEIIGDIHETPNLLNPNKESE